MIQRDPVGRTPFWWKGHIPRPIDFNRRGGGSDCRPLNPAAFCFTLVMARLPRLEADASCVIAAQFRRRPVIHNLREKI